MLLAALRPARGAQRRSVPVTDAITADGVLCFGLDGLSADGVDYDTRENGGVAPELLLSVTP